MIQRVESFKKAGQTVENILKTDVPNNLNDSMVEMLKEMTHAEQREFLRQFNSLLLNVILNRREEVGEDGIEKVKRYRRAISDMNLVIV